MATLFMALSAQFLCIMDVLSKDFNLLVEALGKQVVTMTLSLSIHNTIWREKDCCPEALVGNFFPVFFPPTTLLCTTTRLTSTRFAAAEPAGCNKT